ncbi:E3 ubiquitin-protein ligase TRIM71-like [Saccostrea echinata]|uniref:E3 ubiquitin-protein ligase TRIM71-like n=1 Tax=Saccostrea echinata TaxID=191078 RepID=UPI002A818BCB|nr:E3 ubiquitin-protein ligase TRIM71-like [Saccostrea echinata]
MSNPQAQDVIRCQYCEDKSAVFHCVPCGDELCPECKVFHLKSKVPSGHNIIRLSERFHPTNQVKICEVHLSKAYEACCEDCLVPVCITCIQEEHNKHAIGKLQELYEKQKAGTAEKLSKMKTLWKSEFTQRLLDFKEEENQMKTSHKIVRKNMKKQAEDFIGHISAIMNKCFHDSEEDERKQSEAISLQKMEAERFGKNIDLLIEKLESLIESNHPVDLILYRKKNPDIFNELKLPEKFDIVMPSFTAGHFNKSLNEQQFGKYTANHDSHDSHLKLCDDSLQNKQPTSSASKTLSIKTILGFSVKIGEAKTKKENLLYATCLDDRSAYISGEGPGILLIDRSGTELDNVSTDSKPWGLGVMQDGSLIYTDGSDKAIYSFSLSKEKTKLITTEHGPRGLCCIRSGDILVCMGLFNAARVVKYSKSGKKIQEFQTDQNGERLFIHPRFICENVNDDFCISDLNFMNNNVVVLNKSGNLRFRYDGNVVFKTLKEEFQPSGVATDSLGHILIADNANKAVHLISQDGNFLSYILTEDDGISRPWGISVDTSDNLWLVEEENTCVKVYQYLL